MKTKERLLVAARQEFMEKGYQDSSLRVICSRAEVTTGALYFQFENKEDLFVQVIEPVIRQLQDYMQSLTDQDTDLWFEHHQKMTEFLWNHKQELYILIYGSKGTVYEDVWPQLKQQIEERYFRALKTGRDHSSLIHVLTMMQMYGYVTILSQDYTLEETMRLLEQIEKYRYGGLDALMKQMKTNG